jgi:hypothetical protein
MITPTTAIPTEAIVTSARFFVLATARSLKLMVVISAPMEIAIAKLTMKSPKFV